MIISGALAPGSSGMVYLDRVDSEILTLHDSVVLSNGSFEFNLHQEGMQVAYLRIPATPPLMFYAEPGHIEVQGRVDSAGAIQVSGTGNNDAFMEFQKIAKEEDFKMGPIIDSVKALSFGSNIRSLDSFNHLLKANRERFYTEYARIHPDAMQSLYNAFVLSSNGNFDLAGYSRLISPSILSTSLGRRLTALIESRQATAIGSPAPDITAKDVNDSIVQLSALKGKHVFLQFWSPGCRECALQNVHIMRIFNKLKSPKWAMVSYSVDMDKNYWIEQSTQQMISWINISDHQGWSSSIPRSYGVIATLCFIILIPRAFSASKE